MKNTLTTLMIIFAILKTQAQCDLTQSQNAFFKPVQLQIEKLFTRGLPNANSFELKVNSVSLPVLRKAFPKQQPRYSYFWNFRDGNFLITEEYLGETLHNYLKEDAYNLRIEITPIKAPPELTGRISFTELELEVSDIKAHRIIEHTKINNKKNAQLLNNRCAIPGQPLTIISSIKNNCSNRLNNSKASLKFNSQQLILFDVETYGGDTLVNCKIENDSTFVEVDIANLNIDKQHNFFTPFLVNSDVELGDTISLFLNYTYNCGIEDITEIDTIQLIAAKSHDPSYKKILNKKSCNVLGKDSMEVLIHFENDGEGPTGKIVIEDSLLNEIKIDSVKWQPKETLCTYTSGNLEFINDSLVIQFNFQPIVLNGQKEPGYLSEFDKETTKDEIRFEMFFDTLLVNNIDIPLCNIADIFFDNNAPETVMDCIYCIGNSGVIPKRYLHIDTNVNNIIQKRPPIIFKNNLCINLGESVTIQPDLTEIPISNPSYYWLPNGETDASITVNPTDDALYVLGLAWENGGDKFFALGQIIIEVKKCNILQNSLINIEEVVSEIECHNDSTGIVQLKIIGGNSTYNTVWEDLNTTFPFNNGVSIRDKMHNGIYYYTITDEISKCEYADSLILNESPPLILDPVINKNPNTNLVDIEMLVYGGVSDYSVTWNDTLSSNILSNVSFGTYIAQVNDKSGKIIIDTIILEIPFAGNFNCD